MSDDSDIQNKSGKRRKRQLKSSSSSESSDSGSPLATVKHSRKQLRLSSDSEDTNSDIDSEFLRKLRAKKLPKIPSSEDELSDSETEEIILVRPRKAPPILSDYETGDSNDDGDSSSESALENGDGSTDVKTVDDLFSDSSSDPDGQSEKCPICLAKINNQEIGTPESCDHYFCAICIQEWAKNVNTCPVDRQPFTLILVRQCLEGKVIRQIPVGVPAEIKEVQEDATFCEVCGLCDREDRMLLCDSCDHGYHMECLNPPLEYVPIDEWYCPECAPLHQIRRRNRRRSEVVDDDSDVEDFRPAPRLLPRTRQSERVRYTLRNRSNAQQQQQADRMPMSSSGVESMEGEINGVRHQPTPRRARAKRARRRRTQPKFRIKRIVTDDGVIEVLVKRKRRKYRKKRKNRTLRSAPRTVKGRLANRLGMCAPKVSNQIIPESFNRQEVGNAPINHQRHQAGIPTLDIFGRRDQLDYFSGSDGEADFDSMEGGVGLMSRVRVARPRDRIYSLKKAASVLTSTSPKKPLKLEQISSPASGSLLDSILDSQTLWHSKKTEIKSKSDGSLQVILPKTPKKEILKEENKIDVQNSTAPVIETPMFPGTTNAGVYKPDNSSSGGNTQEGSRGSSEQKYEDRSSQQSYSGSGGSSGYQRYESSVSSSPLRSIAPIRFRMNLPPRRPNIHSYPSDNIPPPPPLRMRSPMVEMSFPTSNSPETSPVREEEDVDIYSDIEQESNVNNENEEKSFGVLEPPPEPPFLMTMEPPPEPPALLMTLNDDASDDEPSGLVIDDPPHGEAYDPCAVNSDDSSTEDAPLAKPPEVPLALKNADLVANYSSDSNPTSGTPSYNPELPTYLSTPIIGPLPRPASHNSSEGEEDDNECPNFSIYSTASMNIAHRGMAELDIPIPPPIETKTDDVDMDIPLPESPKIDKEEESLDIPIPKEDNVEKETSQTSDSEDGEETNDSDKEEDEKDKEQLNEPADKSESHKIKLASSNSYEEEDGDGDDEHEDDDESENDENAADDNIGNESDGCNSNQETVEKTEKQSSNKKDSSETAEDECSTQGDILDLAIESEANLENNIPHDDIEESHEITLAKSPPQSEKNDEKNVESGDKSDGLVDITDEEMSEYDGQDDDLNKLTQDVLDSVKDDKHLESDDDNSLVGGATSAVSAATLNNSDYIQPLTLPGLEGLETETISESEDVNFDELPMEGTEPVPVMEEEDYSSSKKKKKKKNRKTSHIEDTGKAVNESLEFEEGEIVEDKPKQMPKKDKKIKLKQDSTAEVGENTDHKKSNVPTVDNEPSDKKTKKKKDKGSSTRDKSDKTKELKEKTVKVGQADENVSWKKLSKSTKERNYRDGKEREEKEREKDQENKNEGLSRKEKRNKEKRKELERYNVRRLISEKPKRPKKDEFGRDISPSKSGSSLSPYRPPRYRSPLRTRNRSRTRSKSRSRSRGRRRQRSRSRERIRSRDRSRRTRSRDRSRRSRSRNKVSSRSRERRKTPDRGERNRTANRSLSRSRKRSRTTSVHSKRHRSPSYSKSWTPSWSRSSASRSRTPQGRRRSRSISRSKSPGRDQNTHSRSARAKDPPKNLTVIVTNKEALKKKDKKKASKRKDDRRKKRRGQSPAPSKEVFTSGDNILVSVNFKNANKNPELIPATTPLLRESSKRKRDEPDSASKKKKTTSSSKKSPGNKKSSRLAKINEAARNAKPVAIIDLDLSPFREQTPSPKEVIVLTDSDNEEEKRHLEMQDEINRMGHSGINQSMLSLSSIDHGQKSLMSQPESPVSSNFMLNSSGPKTPPEPHIKFSISSKPSQIRMMTNPLMEAEEEMQDENTEDVNEILHKGPNTPPEPPPDLNTPASPPTTPYDPFDPTKSRSPSPQPRTSDGASQLNTSREEKLDGSHNEGDDHAHHLDESRITPPPNELEDSKNTPEPAKVHSTPKPDQNTTDGSPKVSPPAGILELNKVPDDTLMKPIQKLLASANKLDVTVHKSPEKNITIVINANQVKNTNQTPKQTPQQHKAITPNKHQTPKSNAKHQLFSSSMLKQVPILGALSLLPGPPVYTPMNLNSSNKSSGRFQQQNGDPSDDMDIDPSSPYSPGSSEGDDLFEPPIATPPRSSSKQLTSKTKSQSASKFDSLFGSSPAKLRLGRHSSKSASKSNKKSKGSKKEEIKVKLDEDQLKILDDLPSSAVEMQVKDKFLKKLNRQERVVEEVKLVLKPHYTKKHITKDEYKEILRRSVPKICHNKTGEINPIKIQFLVEAYVKKFRYSKKKASGGPVSAAQNKPKPQKTLWS